MRKTVNVAYVCLCVFAVGFGWLPACSDDARDFAKDDGSGAGTDAAAAGTGDGVEAGAGAGAGSGGAPAKGGTGSTEAGSGTGASVSEGGAGPSGPDLSCVEGALEPGDSVSGTTLAADDDFSPACAAGTGLDVAYRFVAPAAGYYSFDSQGSDFDTVVALYSPDCGGTELACNNNVRDLPQAEAVARLTKDQEVVVVLDGNVGDKGSYELGVSAVTCPGLDLTGQPFPAELSTIGQPDEHSPSCGGTAAANSPERTVRWVPEEDGLYRFSVKTNAFSPTLSLYEGAKCGGTLLQCSYNVVSGYPAEVTRRLKAGEAVTLIVDSLDGNSGAFTLDVEPLAEQCPARPLLTQSITGVTLDESSGTTLLSSSCAWAGNQYDQDTPYEEHIYPIHIADSGFFNCTYAFENIEGSWLAYQIRGNDCSGEEVTCSTDGDSAVFSFDIDDAGDYLLVIENTAPFPGLSLTYDLTVQCY